ncbi:hypothetical protein [Secundilactobacillus similis]|uniref:hypothetical protein n=1 Tax=Secundilactobacillus similis TaxID=414682 RepID=UPI0006D1942C|nr:hypothetical protein [Secundilactobacillus similis]
MAYAAISTFTGFMGLTATFSATTKASADTTTTGKTVSQEVDDGQVLATQSKTTIPATSTVNSTSTSTCEVDSGVDSTTESTTTSTTESNSDSESTTTSTTDSTTTSDSSSDSETQSASGVDSQTTSTTTSTTDSGTSSDTASTTNSDTTSATSSDTTSASTKNSQSTASTDETSTKADSTSDLSSGLSTALSANATSTKAVASTDLTDSLGFTGATAVTVTDSGTLTVGLKGDAELTATQLAQLSDYIKANNVSQIVISSVASSTSSNVNGTTTDTGDTMSSKELGSALYHLTGTPVQISSIAGEASAISFVKDFTTTQTEGQVSVGWSNVYVNSDTGEVIQFTTSSQLQVTINSGGYAGMAVNISQVNNIFDTPGTTISVPGIDVLISNQLAAGQNQVTYSVADTQTIISAMQTANKLVNPDTGTAFDGTVYTVGNIVVSSPSLSVFGAVVQTNAFDQALDSTVSSTTDSPTTADTDSATASDTTSATASDTTSTTTNVSNETSLSKAYSASNSAKDSTTLSLSNVESLSKSAVA